MNTLFMTLLYPKETMEEATRLSKTGLQNQINSYQHAFVQGLRENLLPDERLDIVNALPVGIFPRQYSKLWLSGGQREDGIEELSCINLPWLKQHGREQQAKKAIRRWVNVDSQNRTILLYTLYLPYMKAVAAIKKEVPDLRAAVIVTDLPNEWGISSGRKGLLQTIEYAMGNDRLALCKSFDGFVLLTRSMEEVLPIKDKARMVLEGLILTQHQQQEETAIASPTDGHKPAVLYTGTMNKELGLQELLDAFAELPQVELWLCGKGDMEDDARHYARQYPNIRYYGFVPQQQALALQQQAALLINPRSPHGVFTRYSFPSKTLEYLRSGKPVLCYRLDGIPEDYDPYLFYIDGLGADGIRAAVQKALAIDPTLLAERGTKGREYVLTNKNPKVQCAKVTAFLRGLR